MQYSEMLLCPVCASILRLEARALICANGHNFDLAKEGYVNLLLKKQLGDSKEMLVARRDFFAQGLYRPLADTVAELVLAELAVDDEVDATRPSTVVTQERETLKHAPVTILDAGCGEGFYLGHVQEALRIAGRQDLCVGIDLSKEAVKMAARRYKEAFFIVANLNERLVLADRAVQIMLNIFAPRNNAEYARVIAPGGTLLVVIPGARHLVQLREALHLLNIEEDKQQHVVAQFAQHFALVTVRPVAYELRLNNEEITQVVMMTPNYWHLAEETRQAMREMSEIQTQVEFVCLLFRRLEDESILPLEEQS